MTPFTIIQTREITLSLHRHYELPCLPKILLHSCLNTSVQIWEIRSTFESKSLIDQYNKEQRSGVNLQKQFYLVKKLLLVESSVSVSRSVPRRRTCTLALCSIRSMMNPPPWHACMRADTSTRSRCWRMFRMVNWHHFACKSFLDRLTLWWHRRKIYVK